MFFVKTTTHHFSGMSINYTVINHPKIQITSLDRLTYVELFGFIVYTLGDSDRISDIIY